jgi:class 3 adenylate cyclase
MDGVAVVVFSDLVDSTTLLARLGDDHMDLVRRAHLRDVEVAVSASGGRVVKTLGDGAMSRFESALGALYAAARLQAAVEALDAAEGVIGIAARVGVAAGEPVSDGDDLHGMAVVIASRLCSAAASGEVLVQDLVRALVGSREGVRFGDTRSHELKGVPAPVQAAGLCWRALLEHQSDDLVGGPHGDAAAATAERGGQEADPLARQLLSPAELNELLAAERAGEPFLAFRDDHKRLHLFVLGREGDACRVGRRAEMDISIPWDEEISGLHAELQCLIGEWIIRDDGLSRNGTFVNRQRIAARRRLRDGDRIRVGRTVLAYSAAQAQRRNTTMAAGQLQYRRRED